MNRIEDAAGQGRLIAEVVRAVLAQRDDAARDREIVRVLEENTALHQALAAAHRQTVAAEAKTQHLIAALESIDGGLARLPFGWPLDGLIRHSRRLRRRLLARLRMMAARRVLRRSALFHAEWYLRLYADVAQSGVAPLDHYILHGARERRDPGPDFSTEKYLADNPDVLAAGVNPLAHYETAGRAEGRRIFAAARPTRAVASGGHAVRIVYVSGEAATPGHTFRVARYADAARRLGCEVTVTPRADVMAHLPAIAACRLLVIWRAAWDNDIAAAVETARTAGARIQLDVDDLMFEPDLARRDIIDGIRSQGFSEHETAAFFAGVAKVVRAADHTSAPTRLLAERLRQFGKPSFILPNGFDMAVWRHARRAVRERAHVPADGLVRIGYPAGTRTHQRDFEQAAQAIASVLADRPQARLVLFRDSTTPLVDPFEFAAFEPLRAQVEWREMVPVEQVVREMARYDIAIAPLEVGNPFCEAKSELKFFEAALVDIPIVASPTEPFRTAITDGSTGYLASSTSEWRSALLGLVDDLTLRRRIGRAGYFAALWRYGEEARQEHMRLMLSQLFAVAAEAARAFELSQYRHALPLPASPHIPSHRLEVLQDRLEDAAVTVVVLCRQPTDTVIVALESVHAQTLALIDIVLVDDGAGDVACAVARRWMVDHLARFNRAALVRNDSPGMAGLSCNAGFANAETPFVIKLGADETLDENFAAGSLAAIERTAAAFATFGQAAPVLLRLSAWAELGGFIDGDRMAARGFYGEVIA